ncbi:hypothetical protein G4B88_017839 [Cannabis sativa]|uniref:Uncharacterized protein n=1 Tax=Cannabis sativa TaxID=3483 RepID=A0A7J6GQL0_CANSA|nr:hypothetical protein G4B88_017839 [Cannabis sativa]
MERGTPHMWSSTCALAPPRASSSSRVVSHLASWPPIPGVNIRVSIATHVRQVSPSNVNKTVHISRTSRDSKNILQRKLQAETGSRSKIIHPVVQTLEELAKLSGIQPIAPK